MTWTTVLYTWLRGERVGTDIFGNRYYRDPGRPRWRRERRWVIYRGAAEATSVPAEWHGWLHHTTDHTPLPGGAAKRPWQREHQPNLTGTDAAYRPPGHVLKGGRRARSTGDYQPWQPPQ